MHSGQEPDHHRLRLRARCVGDKRRPVPSGGDDHLVAGCEVHGVDFCKRLPCAFGSCARVSIVALGRIDEPGRTLDRGEQQEGRWWMALIFSQW
jgi:hypothetical protein